MLDAGLAALHWQGAEMNFAPSNHPITGCAARAARVWYVRVNRGMTGKLTA